MKKILPGLLLLPFSAVAQQDSVQQHSMHTSMEAPKKIVVYKQPNVWAQSTNFTNALSVEQTGVQTFSSGAPGSDIEMIIRGNADPYGNSRPMVMIDGMPFYGDYSAINTYNIESINVEKIPANFSAPLSLASNGIIHIQTKKAPSQPSKWHVNLNANLGLNSRAIPQYDIITDPGQYYETSWQFLRRTLVSGGGMTPEQYASDQLIPWLGYNLYNVPDAELVDPATGKLNPNAQLKYKDSWKNVLTRPGLSRQYNVSAAKTWKKADIFISGNYAKEDGYIILSSFERMGTNLQAHYRPLKGLEMGIFGLYTYSKDQTTAFTGIRTSNNPIFALFNNTPVSPVYLRDANGDIMTDPSTGAKKYAPYRGIDFMSTINSLATYTWNKNLFVTPSIKYEILTGLNIAVQASYLKRVKLYTSTPDDTCAITDNFILQPEISYRTQWNKHQLTAKAQYFSMRYDLERRNEPIDRFKISDVQQDIYRILMGDVAYDFNNQFLLQAKLQKHLDITTRQYIPKHNWNWAATATWKQHFSRINTELTAGYSRSVILNSLPYPKVDQNIYGANLNGADPAQKQVDLGIKVFGSRIVTTLNWFQKNGAALFLLRDFPTTVGGSYFDQGLGIRTRGIEMNINARVTNPGSPVNWNLGLYTTHWRTRVTAMPGNDTIFTARSYIAKGADVNEWYAPEYAGVDPKNGAALYYQYKNGSKALTTDINSLVKTDYQLQGSTLPVIFGSLTNSISYRRFGLQFAISYALGGKTYDTYYPLLMGGYGNYHKDAMDAWNPDNKTSTIPALDLSYNYDKYSSRFTTSASWASLKYVNLSYRLPFKLYKKSGFDNMSVYASGENLFFLSARKGFNPNEAPDAPMFGYLPMRTVRLGVNIDL